MSRKIFLNEKNLFLQFLLKTCWDIAKVGFDPKKSTFAIFCDHEMSRFLKFMKIQFLRTFFRDHNFQNRKSRNIDPISTKGVTKSFLKAKKYLFYDFEPFKTLVI